MGGLQKGVTRSVCQGALREYRARGSLQLESLS